MTSATKGVYITLLCLMYEAEGPLKQPWDILSRRSGCTVPAFKKAVSALVDEGKIKVTDEGIWSDKCDKHIAQRRERSDSAKAAAEIRWKKEQGKQCPTDADAMRAQCQPEPDPEPKLKEEPSGSSKIQPPKKRKPVKRSVPLPDGWVPNEANVKHALSKQLSPQEIDHEADRFRDHHIAKGNAYKCWDAAWRTWISNSFKFGNRSMAGQQSTGGYRQGGSIASIVARRHAGG